MQEPKSKPDRVVVREEKDGTILLVFPDDTARAGYITYFANFGGHGEMSLDYYRRKTKPVNIEVAEDRAIKYAVANGVTLRVVQRIAR